MDEISKRELAVSAELLQERIENDHLCREGDRSRSGSDPSTNDLDEAVVEDLRIHTGRDFERVEPYVNVEDLPAEEPLPSWTREFSEMIDFLDEIDGAEPVPVDVGRNVPFRDILSWIVEYNRRRFLDELDTAHLCDEAVRDFERHLLDRLSDAGTKALHSDFVQFVADDEPDALEDDARSPDSTRLYDRYVSTFLNGRAVPFFETFPVLARQVTCLVENWRTMVARFVSRLNEDRRELRDLVDADDPGAPSRLDIGAGDPHDEGQSVIVVEFESGDEVVYKPRSIEPVKQLYRFESWLSERDESVPELQTARVITKSGYGWMEKIDPVEFSDLEAVERYYRGTGALVCVLYVLNAADCQYENVIAGRRSPVLVDAEALLDASIAEVPNSRFNRKVQRDRARSSLAGTLLLPFKVGTHARTNSGLGTTQARKGWTRKVVWTDVNTDAMDYEYEIPEVEPEDNVPTYAGELASPDEFADEIVDGFERTYDAILGSKAEVKRRIVEQFDGITVRKVVLASALYDALSNTLTNPKYLSSGASYGYRIQETLSRRLSTLHSAVRPEKWDDVLRAERNSLLRGDIPKFTMMTDDDAVYYGGKVVCSTDFEKTGVEQVRDRVDDMSVDDRRYQRMQIEASFGDDRIAEEGHW